MKSVMLAIPNGIVLAIGLGMAIVGILLATHTLPDPCSGFNDAGAKEGRDTINSYAFIGGMPACIAALLAIIGGVLGSVGGKQKSTPMVGCTVALMWFAVLLCFITAVVSLLGMAISSVYSEENYPCEDDLSNYCNHKTGYNSVCKTEIDSFRSYGSKSGAGMAFAFLLGFVSFATAIVDCSACLCCPDNYEMSSQPKQPVGAAVTYGQPAENAQ